MSDQRVCGCVFDKMGSDKVTIVLATQRYSFMVRWFLSSTGGGVCARSSDMAKTTSDGVHFGCIQLCSYLDTHSEASS